MRIYLNDNWTFYHKDSPNEKEIVRIPHANVVTPFNYFDDKEYQFVSVYERELIVDKKDCDKLFFLNFEGAAHKAEVYVNDKLVKTHLNGYTAFKCEISKYLKFDKPNKIKVVLDSRESLNIPPFGHVIDYMTYGGIYRDVYLEIKEKAYVEDVFVKTNSCLRDEKELQFDIKLCSNGSFDNSNVVVKIFDGRKLVAKATCEHLISEISIILKSFDLKNWSVDTPVMYKAVITLNSNGLTDTYETRFGVRQIEFKADGFYLNGKRLKIRGLNRHQSYPYVGYAMPQSVQEHDAYVLKKELGLNAVRTSHYPQSHYFLDACDDLGLLVFTESPGWQHIGNKEWKEQHLENVKEMVLQYRNHPSIILWGVRVNESMDDEWLYTRANEIARKLDDTRPTSGVRYLQMSQMLEDVYAFNDFSHTGDNRGLSKKITVTPKVNKPYLVSEYNGHMFPTKSFDDEIHRLSHALRHARVVDSMYAESNGISGCFGWCMADYNTHKDFGSGDRICYHGVLDMFRNPKLAAALYASQGEEKPVLEISSSMDIGEHPAGSLGDVYVFTNADCVNLYKNGEFVRRFDPDFEDYPNLPHPPIKIDDLIGCLIEKQEGISEKSSEGLKRAIHGYMCNSYAGALTPKNIEGVVAAVIRDKIAPARLIEIVLKHALGWGGDVVVYRFDAIKNNQVVKSITKAPANQADLEVTADHKDLCEKNSYDVACVNIKAVSEYGNLLNYYDEPVALSTKGPIEIIGPKVISLRGGMSGTYVKTTGKSGKASLLIVSDRIGTKEIEFKCKT